MNAAVLSKKDLEVIAEVVIELNQQAEHLLGGPSQLAIVPGATHLFEEPGTLKAAADLARDWFTEYLTPGGP